MFYSKSTGGFYDEVVHGYLKHIVIDPNWVRPEIDGEPDMDAVPETISIDNPACTIPLDAVEITQEEHNALLAGQSSGMVISSDANGVPILTQLTPPPLTPLEKLAALDAENPITPRNLRQMAMLMAEGFKQVTGGALDISQIPGVRDAYVVEAKADALRAQL